MKAVLRLKLANAEQQLEKVRIRAGNAENNCRKLSAQVVEEKDLRAAADQRAGDLTALLEIAQQQLQDVEKEKAAEDVVTHVAATQTYGNVVEFATQTEDGDNLELKGHVSTFRREENGGNLELEGHVPALKQSTAEPETVRDVEQDKYLGVDEWIDVEQDKPLGVDDWICMNEHCGAIIRDMPFETECYFCGTDRGYVPGKRKKSKSCVQQRGRGRHRPRGRGK